MIVAMIENPARRAEELSSLFSDEKWGEATQITL